MILGHTSGCAAMPVRPRATPLADPHASRILYRSQCLFDNLSLQRLCTHQTPVLCTRAWDIRPFCSIADPQASLDERQNASFD